MITVNGIYATNLTEGLYLLLICCCSIKATQIQSRILTNLLNKLIHFIYRAVSGMDTGDATVTLTACSGGPTVFTCWQEAPYLAKLGELGYRNFQEGFENDAVWGSVRSPSTALSVLSQGITWQTNHPDPPASNEITADTSADIGSVPDTLPCDLDEDGKVDNIDRHIFLSSYRLCTGDAGYLPKADYDNDGCITLNDYREWYICYKRNR